MSDATVDRARGIEIRDNPRTRRETSDADLRVVAWLLLGLAVFVIASIAILTWIFPHAVHGVDVRPGVAYPEPRLQIDPAADLKRFEDVAARQLGGYGYVDRAQGIVHIPIDEAMKRVAATGIPDWPKAAR